MVEITNPLIYSDLPDVDVIRVDDCFYMSSTTMHMMPGIPIMRSTNLRDWEICSYVYESLEDNDAHNLLNGLNIYGKGSWATSLRFHEGRFFVCFNSNDMRRSYIYQADNPAGPWQRYVLNGCFHDPSLLFDTNGRVYLVYGGGDIYLVELTRDATALLPGGVHQKIISTEKENVIVPCEGAHIYKINEEYYIFLIQWMKTGSARRRQWCYRSRDFLGPYQGRVVLDDDLGYFNRGVAQGGIVDTPSGEWCAPLFQDHDAVGRVPVLVPVMWEKGWPILGQNGKVPSKFFLNLPESSIKTGLLQSDDFSQASLGPHWQWNHNPDLANWSLKEHPGYLTLRVGRNVSHLLQAQNSLTQRTVGPCCSGEISLETSNMKPGDYAGIAAFQNHYGFVGVKMDKQGEKHIIMAVNQGDGQPAELESLLLHQEKVFLKIDFDFTMSRDKADFYYSLDGKEWICLGESLNMKYTLDHFMGYRVALFNYGTMESGGCVKFKYFKAWRFEGK
ncbi:MAG: glycoside hydrolase 43 family protein [Spirochaetales bacterium]|nr:glycoside hydrolase 43 family protein [Spirochaetales bacterium]